MNKLRSMHQTDALRLGFGQDFAQCLESRGMRMTYGNSITLFAGAA